MSKKPYPNKKNTNISDKLHFYQKIGFKLSLFTTLGIFLVGISTVSYMAYNSRALLDQANEERSQAALTMMESIVDDYKTDSKNAATHLADYDSVILAVESGKPDAVRAAATAAVDSLGLDVDFITITDSTGTVLARTHSDKAGDSVEKQENVSMALSGETTTHVETGTEIRLSVRTGAPVKDPSGRVIGVVSTGYSMVSDDFVDKMKHMTGNEFTIFIGDERANTTLTKNGKRIIGTKMNSSIAKTVLQEHSAYIGKTVLVGQPCAVVYDPIVDKSGNAIGAYFSGISIAKADAALNNSTRSAIILVFILMIAATTGVIMVAVRFIVKPVGAMAGVAAELAKGNLEVELRYQSKDELGVLSNALRETISSLQRYIHDISDKLHQMADRDMRVTVNLDYVGDFIAIQDAIEHIAASLNETMLDMNAVADQVDSGAKQLADSSTLLSQGATEQASAVEELSASVEEISAQTTQNAQNAQDAYELAKRIQADTSAGSVRMTEMLNAMQEINVSSERIHKIIKVIDDIAFQTNILALNAAVEAARAGQHGKGFAVVADEVRNLAGKSAQAAKETTELIESSIHKVDAGTKIANETSDALSTIVEGILQASELIGAIASASNEQATALDHVNQGILQVSQVVQNNAAVAEESAAASEELSSQAEELKQSVSTFKLGDMRASHREAPPFRQPNAVS